ncbi:hypothetical protein HG535_0A06900 [Zygotorulaspora mrakii]|uniref:Spindle pole component BBP1 n=1 Tax=Zygotorulaspora mrakii TaxID=42260 RepID=A0A7H9AWG7_ZYGMR|nr:uncharacterized protein HG535_0A06900 [Zygotorulaspora mrakii]QLG70748.1 hypothetical protein HG535_0A06900 [Zygotorulaspora mrakii]
MLWSSADTPSQDGTENGYGGLYKWTMDALFGSRISPSRKFREFSQDDTNYNVNLTGQRLHRTFDKPLVEAGSERLRSTSLSGLDPTFYNRYELLPELSDDDGVDADIDVYNRRKNSPFIDHPINPVPQMRKEPTDTFGARKGYQDRPSKKYHDDDDDDFSIVAKSPLADDPIISRLFEGGIKNAVRPSQIPGKFPSPVKVTATKFDYTEEYLSILDQLEKNDRLLSDMNTNLQTKRDLNIKQEETYKMKYRHTRSELIKELKHSKALYDNYYKLYGKYQQLKTLSQDAVQLQTQVSNLETQLVDSAIEKEKQIHSLTKRMFDLEQRVREAESSKEREAQRYEAHIAGLEAQLAARQLPPSGVSSLSFSPSRSHYRDQSSLSDYNAVVDTQFLKNLH